MKEEAACELCWRSEQIFYAGHPWMLVSWHLYAVPVRG